MKVIKASFTIEIDEDELKTLHSLIDGDMQEFPESEIDGPRIKKHNKMLKQMLETLGEYMPHESDEE